MQAALEGAARQQVRLARVAGRKLALHLRSGLRSASGTKLQLHPVKPRTPRRPVSTLSLVFDPLRHVGAAPAPRYAGGAGDAAVQRLLLRVAGPLIGVVRGRWKFQTSRRVPTFGSCPMKTRSRRASCLCIEERPCKARDAAGENLLAPAFDREVRARASTR